MSRQVKPRPCLLEAATAAKPLPLVAAGRAAAILELQRTVGNAATSAFLNVQRGDPPPAAPVATAAAGAAGEPVVIGYVYTIRGTVDGEAVVYTGSTMRDLVSRIYKDAHTWRQLAQQSSTSISVSEIKAIPKAEATARGTLRAAYNQAVRAAEQVVLKRNRGLQPGEVIELNEVDAATEANIELWGDLHSVRIGPRMPFKAGIKIGAVAAFELLQIFLMYRDHKLDQYVWAPYLLEDDGGVFTIREQDRGIFRANYFWKKYVAGSSKGSEVSITKDEYYRLKGVAEILWGTVDFWGDFVPGLLQQELPIAPDPNIVT